MEFGIKMAVTDKYRYIIGIDLGTTNSAVSYVDLENELTSDNKKKIQTFYVPQLVGAGEIGTHNVLPSFLYIPGDYDISEEILLQPFETAEKRFAGVFARDHGAKVPARLVSSAKSWLCHDKADRRAKILPWGAGNEVGKVSPVEATSLYLDHIKKAWNAQKGNDESLYLENQFLVITTPASFDEVARDLTIEAAKMAGFKKITLLEEPLAAFYSWLIGHESDWHEHVKPGELILVCDIGGGTTDFTLITLIETDGTPRFERLAVGDHLILGGDNIDLALARRVEMAFGKNKPSISGDRWKNLCHQCRRGKERILDGKSDVERITLMGEGSRLIGGTVSADLTREMLEDVILNGFFPFADATEKKKNTARKGISEFGLPYEQEPAMTKHLGWFLEKHKDEVETLIDNNHAPSHILFNGGSLKPEIITEKIRAGVRYWFDEDDESLPRTLQNPEPDLAVALGASYYGMAKLGKGVRVGSGSPRAYYLGISTDNQNVKQAVCLVERGLDEGSFIELLEKKMTVLANRPVSFDVYSSSFRSGDKCGDLVDIDETLTQLPPVQTIIKYGKKNVQTDIPVKIEAEYTEIGTLVIWCRALESDHRWKLNFQLRNEEHLVDVTETEVFEESVVNDACDIINSAFNKKIQNGKDISAVLSRVPKKITKIAERPKNKWPLSFIRTLSDEMIKNIDSRMISADYETRWLNLTGFTLRPGFGHGFDEERIRQLWKIYKKGASFPNNPQAAKEWWIMWRRISAGLTAGQQRQFFQDTSRHFFFGKGKKAVKKLPPQEKTELWMAIANMERLLVKDKIKLGRQLLSELSKKSPHQYFWALSRIGARDLLYGSVDRVIPPSEVSSWILKLITTNYQDSVPVVSAVVQMARKTGDKIRDIDQGVLEKISDFMKSNSAAEAKIAPLFSVVDMTEKDEKAVFGESLPAGLIMHE